MSSIQKINSDLKTSKEDLNLLKKLFPNQNNNYIAQKNDEIDVNLMLYLQDKQIPLKISRLSEGKYLYGSLKIELILENSRLMANFKNEVLSFDDFNKIHLVHEMMETYQINLKSKIDDINTVKSSENIPHEISQEKIKQKKEPNKFSTPVKPTSVSKNSSGKGKESKEKEHSIISSDVSSIKRKK